MAEPYCPRCGSGLYAGDGLCLICTVDGAELTHAELTAFLLEHPKQSEQDRATLLLEAFVLTKRRTDGDPRS